MRDFYSQFMGSQDIVFDIGAHVGNRTRVFAELAGMVVAVEPQSSCIQSLRKEFWKTTKVKLIEKAVGAQEGSSAIRLSETLSSLAPAWISAVQGSGRFGVRSWSDPQPVELTTLDKLMVEFGTPAFIKIDVEGYEREVLKGLSTPVKALSYEITPLEYLEEAVACSERLCDIGMTKFNYSLGESMRMELPGWVSCMELAGHLEKYKDNVTFGDVYASI
jgi:FkbM family methyltransferase